MVPPREPFSQDTSSSASAFPESRPEEPGQSAEVFAEAAPPITPPEPAWLVEHLDESPLPPEPAWDDHGFWEQDESIPPEPAWDDPIWQGTDWEPVLLRVQPHPTGEWQALTWMIHTQWRAQVQVCARAAHQVIWQPEEAILLAWAPSGDQVAVIREQRRKDPWQPYTFERYSWPELHPLGKCPLHVPAGWPYALGLWPQENLAVFAWTDQDHEGVAWVHLSAQGDHQEQDGWMSPNSQLESMRVFLESLLEREDRQALYWTF